MGIFIITSVEGEPASLIGPFPHKGAATKYMRANEATFKVFDLTATLREPWQPAQWQAHFERFGKEGGLTNGTT